MHLYQFKPKVILLFGCLWAFSSLGTAATQPMADKAAKEPVNTHVVLSRQHRVISAGGLLFATSLIEAEEKSPALVSSLTEVAHDGSALVAVMPAGLTEAQTHAESEDIFTQYWRK